jgi:gamma-tubulin complex component 3
LVEFDRLIAILENDLFSTCEYDHSFATVGLSLKRLYVWSQGPMYKLRFMLSLLQACQDTRGGGILTVLDRFSNHGDPFIQKFIQKILPKVLNFR